MTWPWHTAALRQILHTCHLVQSAKFFTSLTPIQLSIISLNSDLYIGNREGHDIRQEGLQLNHVAIYVSHVHVPP